VYVDRALEIWLDIARIHAAGHRYQLAMNAYETLAYNLGALIVDRNYGNTTRLARTGWGGWHSSSRDGVSVVGYRERRYASSFQATVAKALIQLRPTSSLPSKKARVRST
jgi:hypothetical protein